MLSLLQIDGLGKRYGMLPSEILSRASTLDLYIMDAVMSWEEYQHKKQNSKGNFVPNVTQEQLLRIFNKNKNDKSQNKNN